MENSAIEMRDVGGTFDETQRGESSNANVVAQSDYDIVSAEALMEVLYVDEKRHVCFDQSTIFDASSFILPKTPFKRQRSSRLEEHQSPDANASISRKRRLPQSSSLESIPAKIKTSERKDRKRKSKEPLSPIHISKRSRTRSCSPYRVYFLP